MKQDVSMTLEIAHLELLRRAYTHNDLESWAEFQQRLEKTVRTWFHKHPGYEVVCSIQSDNHFIPLAFERLWNDVQEVAGLRCVILKRLVNEAHR